MTDERQRDSSRPPLVRFRDRDIHEEDIGRWTPQEAVAVVATIIGSVLFLAVVGGLVARYLG